MPDGQDVPECHEALADMSVHESRKVTIVMVTHAAALMPRGTRTIEMAMGRVTADSAGSPIPTPGNVRPS
jgi:predicted ABC-type transport system involved in lysophospholipase L1 biosynthesis ATPase subunit